MVQVAWPQRLDSDILQGTGVTLVMKCSPLNMFTENLIVNLMNESQLMIENKFPT